MKDEMNFTTLYLSVFEVLSLKKEIVVLYIWCYFAIGSSSYFFLLQEEE